MDTQRIIFVPLASDLEALGAGDASTVKDIAKLINAPNLDGPANIIDLQTKLRRITEPLQREIHAHPGKYKLLVIEFRIFTSTLPPSALLLFGKLNEQHASEEKMRIELMYLAGRERAADVDAWIALHRRLDADPLRNPFTLVRFVNAAGVSHFDFLLATFCR
jgi:hypothetical protein